MSRLDSVLEKVFAEHWKRAIEVPRFSDLEEWDSLRYVELVVALQREFGIDLSAAEIQRLVTWEGVRSVLESRGIQA